MIQVEERQELLDLFEPDEGTIDLIYGRIGNGKTYCATEMILDDLRRGHVVYTNWHLNYEGFDERQSIVHMVAGLIFPWRKRYYQFPKENLIYFNPEDIDVEFLSSLTDCDVYIDEGQWIFDSYEKTNFSKAKRRLILHTRHLNRRLVIITQRPTAIQVSARGNVNRYFKCEKWLSWPLIVFRQWEYQDMVGETVDETQPVGKPRVFVAKKRIFNAYNSKYLRGGIPRSQELHVNAWDFSYLERLYSLFKLSGLKAGKFGSRFFSRSTSMGLNEAKDVKELSSAPTIESRKVTVAHDLGIRSIPLREDAQSELPF